jgi:ribonuclease HI
LAGSTASSKAGNMTGNMTSLRVYTDGGARGNPGPAAIAVLITDETGKLLSRHSEYIGIATNNVAEYRAVLRGLVMARKFRADSVLCIMDSKLVASQLGGMYKVKKVHLKELVRLVKEAEEDFKSVRYEHVRRNDSRIKVADRLLNEMLDRVGRTRK